MFKNSLTENEIWILISKYVSGNIETHEHDILMNWLNENPEHQTMLSQAIKIWKNSPSEHLVFTTPELAWYNWKLKHQSKHKKTLIVADLTKKYIRYSGIAASLLVLIGISLYFLFLPKNIKVETKNKPTQIALSEGSVITLNRNTIIEYPRKFKQNARTVKLTKGEAYFSVNRQTHQPFIVFVANTEIKVLGTKFNILSTQNGDVEVLVSSGKVSVKVLPTKEEIILHQNEQAIYTAANMNLKKLAHADLNLIAWKTQQLIFKESELNYVFKILEKTYGITIKCDEKILNYKLTANYSQLPITDIVKILEKTFHIRAQVINNGYYFMHNP